MSKIIFGSTIALPAPMNASNSMPIDPRLVVENFADITGATNNMWTDTAAGCVDAYLGMQIYVNSEKTTYMYVGPYSAGDGVKKDEAIKAENWRKISDSDTKSDLLLTNIKVNGVNGTNSNHVASVIIDSNDIQLGNDYNGQEIKSGTTVVTPASADTVSTAVKKIIDIILDDEKVISASENNLNDHINDLSGKTITEITSKDNSVTITKGEDTANDTISVDLKVDPTKISALDLPLGLEYTPRRTGGNATLKLISTTDKTKQSIDVSDFVIDKMVKKVELISGGTIVRITWNADTTADSVDSESSGTDTTVYTDVNLKDIAQYYVFNKTATSGSNVAFTTSVNNETGVRTISANVDAIDCGEYEGDDNA